MLETISIAKKKTVPVATYEKRLISSIQNSAVKTTRKYSDAQISNIRGIITDCEALLKKYPLNIEARKTLDRCKAMLGAI